MKIIKVLTNESLDNQEAVLSQIRNECLNEKCLLPVFDIDELKIGDENFDKKLKGYFNNSDKVIFLGNEHSVSLPLITAFSKIYSNFGLIVFDAHPDAADENDLLPYLIKNNIIKKENIALVGIRNWQKQEYTFLKENKIRFFEMAKIMEIGRQDLIDTIMESCRRFDALYISIDMDVVDPAFAPAVNELEPGGLTSRELLFFLQKLKLLNNLKAVDISEVNHKEDINNITSKLAAKLIVELS